MAITPSSTSQQKPLSAKERLELAQSELARLRTRVNRGSTWTAIIGVLLVVILTGYFLWGAKLWAEFSEPKALVNFAQTTLDDFIPTARSTLVREVTKSAPIWAADLSRELMANIPDARKKLGDFVVEELEKKLQETDIVTEAEFRRFLRNHRGLMEERFKELAKSPRLAERSVKELFEAMEDDLKLDLKADAAALLRTLKAANRNWRDLQFTPEKDLTEDQKLERRAWMIGRLIYLQTFEPNLINKFRVAAKPPRAAKPGPKQKPPLIKPDNKKPKNDGKPAKTGKTQQTGSVLLVTNGATGVQAFAPSRSSRRLPPLHLSPDK